MCPQQVPHCDATMARGESVAETRSQPTLMPSASSVCDRLRWEGVIRSERALVANGLVGSGGSRKRMRSSSAQAGVTRPVGRISETSSAAPWRSIAPCARCREASGTGRRRIRTGQGPRTRRFANVLRRRPRRRMRRHAAWSPPMRSMTATACCSSTRWRCRARSRSSLQGANRWSC